MSENWLPVVGYEGLYSVSDHGRVRSEERLVGARSNSFRRIPERILQATFNGAGYLHVGLHRDAARRSYRVHCLVMSAFVGPVPPGLEILHHDDIKTNNHLENLRYGTRSENLFDRVRNGRHPAANRTTCEFGHQLTPRSDGSGRRCRPCQREYQRLRRGQRREALRSQEVSA